MKPSETSFQTFNFINFTNFQLQTTNTSNMQPENQQQMKKYLILFLTCLVSAQIIATDGWISHPAQGPGTFFFRKTIQLGSLPDQFLLQVSGDSRFELFVNNEKALLGPVLGDVQQWNHHVIDIGPYLKKGANVLAIELVKWEGRYLHATRNPAAVLVRSVAQQYSMVNTSDSRQWKTLKSPAHALMGLSGEGRFLPGFDSIDANALPWGWQTVDFDDSKWQDALIVGGLAFDHMGLSPWNLKKAPSPELHATRANFSGFVRHSTPEAFPEGFLSGNGTAVIPKNTEVSLLIRADKLLNGRLCLTTSYGKNAKVTVRYAEGLMDKNGVKVNRNKPSGHFKGQGDVFVLGGGRHLSLRTTSERTCRFVQLEVVTQNEHLELHDFYLENHHFHMKGEAGFACSDASLSKIWDAGAHTISLLSGDLLYSSVANEKVQMLPEAWAIGLAACYYYGDAGLLKQALDHFYQSLMPDGLVNACAPCNTTWLVPHYALFYVLMLNDYYQYSGDLDFIKERLHAITAILQWYEGRITSNDVVNVSGYDQNVRYRANNNELHYGTAFNTILYVYALQVAGNLYEKCGAKEMPIKYRYLEEKLRRGIVRNNYIKGTQRFVEEKGGEQQLLITNIFALLAGIVEMEDPGKHLRDWADSDSMLPLTLFERFFMGRLLSKLQDGEIYETQILHWHNMILDGLTTLGNETYSTTGTDVYGGGVTPCLNLISLTAGISPYEAGYNKIMIAPGPGSLESFKATCHIPQGWVTVGFEKGLTGNIQFDITLPQNITGYLRWEGKLTPLRGGVNKVGK
jgi:alpha-L-rhamnosidase